MARSSSKIRVMIPSGCETQFPLKTAGKLSDVRRDLKRHIEAMAIATGMAFEVWINASQRRRK